jgi:hypothetical protein
MWNFREQLIKNCSLDFEISIFRDARKSKVLVPEESKCYVQEPPAQPHV